MSDAMPSSSPNWQVPADLWWAMELELQAGHRRGTTASDTNYVLAHMTATQWAWVIDALTPPRAPAARRQKHTRIALPQSPAAAQKEMLAKRDLEILRTWIERLEWNDQLQAGVLPNLSITAWHDVLEQLVAQHRAQGTGRNWGEALAEWIRAGRLFWSPTARRARAEEPAPARADRPADRAAPPHRTDDFNAARLARLITSVVQNETERGWTRRILSVCLTGLPPALLGFPDRWSTVVPQHFGPLVEEERSGGGAAGSAPPRAQPARRADHDEAGDPPRARFAARMRELLLAWGQPPVSSPVPLLDKAAPPPASGAPPADGPPRSRPDLTHVIDLIWCTVDHRRREDNDLGLFGRALKARRDWPAAAIADLVARTGNPGVLGDFDDIADMPPDALRDLLAESGPYWSTNTARVVIELGHDARGELLLEAQAATIAWLEQRHDEDLRRIDKLMGPRSLEVLVTSTALVERLPARLLTRLVANLPSAARIRILGTLASVRAGTLPTDERLPPLVHSGRS